MKYQKYSIIYVCSFFLTISFSLFYAQASHASAGTQIGRFMANFISNPTMLGGIILGLVTILFIGAWIYDQINR